MIDLTLQTQSRSDELLQSDLSAIRRRTDRLFVYLMVAQWSVCVAAAVWISPQAWAGSSSSTQVHVWAAVFLGGLLASLPVALAVFRPAAVATRHVVAVAQMLFSALLIHLTGGRIETHFHVFGSLALLAAYRDWRVLLTATAIVTLDHTTRGALWPASIYGVLEAGPWRTLEHVAWVVFEDTFLLVTIRQSVSEMHHIAGQRALLESNHRLTEETVRHRTAELAHAERKMRLIFESAPYGILLVDQDGVVRMVNPRVERMFGYSADELVGRDLELLIPERPRRRLADLSKDLQGDLSCQISYSEDATGVGRDGHEFPVEVRETPLQTEEGVFVLAAVVDITERERSERELRESAAQLQAANDELTKTEAELKTKNRELDEFTYIASHDLQEPIRKLIAFSELLKEDAGDNLNEQALKDLGFIVDAASRMRQLVQDLLALSRAGRSAMKSEPVSLEDCRQIAIDALQLRIEETGAVIVGDELPEVFGDHTMLTQLYQNLLENALRFVADRRPEITLTVEERDDSWVLGVLDNGIGIQQEYAHRIFQPFQRLHRRDQYEGTGIGLSICRKTVERHRGRLWVESSLGEGSHFKFTIPKRTEEKPCDDDSAKEEELSFC